MLSGKALAKSKKLNPKQNYDLLLASTSHIANFHEM